MNIRTSLVVFRAAHNWRTIVVSVLAATALAVWLGRTSADFLFQVGYFGFPLIAIKSISSVFEYSQRTPVWSLLAQRPESDTRTMWSLLRTGALFHLGLCSVLLLGLVVAGSINPNPSTNTASFIIAILWVLIAGLVAATTSTMARAGTAGLAILWMIMPFVNGFVQRALGYSDSVRDAINFLAPPIDAALLIPRVMSGAASELGTLATAQLIVFPVLCIAVISLRLNALANPDLPRIE